MCDESDTTPNGSRAKPKKTGARRLQGQRSLSIILSSLSVPSKRSQCFGWELIGTPQLVGWPRRGDVPTGEFLFCFVMFSFIA